MDAESVQKVAVVGAGTMGPGLALVFAAPATPSRSTPARTATLEKALSVVAADLGTLVRHGLLEAGTCRRSLARIAPTTSLVEAGAGASLVVEAVAEDLDVKRAVFAELDAYCPDGAIFTSTTSYLDIYPGGAGAASPHHGHRALVRAAAHRPARRGRQGRADERRDGLRRGRAARASRQDAGGHGPVRAGLLRQSPAAQHRTGGLLPARQRLPDAGAARRWPSRPASCRAPWSSASCSATTSPASTSAWPTWRTPTTWSRRGTTRRAASSSASSAATSASRPAGASSTTAAGTSRTSSPRATTRSSRRSPPPATLGEPAVAVLKLPAGKVIITAALNGAFATKDVNPNVPEQPDEIARAARECCRRRRRHRAHPRARRAGQALRHAREVRGDPRRRSRRVPGRHRQLLHRRRHQPHHRGAGVLPGRRPRDGVAQHGHAHAPVRSQRR